MSWDQKKVYLNGLIEYSERKRIFVEDSRRCNTKSYYLNHNLTRKQVCSQMFFNTLGISETMARKWTHMQSNSKRQTRLKVNERVQKLTYEKRLKFLENWLEKIPKIDSHYRRKYTNKIYFESDFKSFKEIFDLYLLECKANEENGIFPVSYPNFMQTIKKGNYSLFKPRNDQCDLCLKYKAKNISQDQFDEHRKEIELMKTEKENDIENSKSGLCLLFCIDMQAVKLVPQLKASASYYKMKLQVHNLTIYNVISHESDNYIWDETEGNLVASTFATCIINHLKNAVIQSPDINHIIIYSDGCFYQNRNVVLSNALLSLCEEKNVTIEHKYLVVGHTQMECDSTHSLIERKIKDKQINLPSQLVDLIHNARTNPTPFQVHHLNHRYFLDYESVPKRYSTIRPGKLCYNIAKELYILITFLYTGKKCGDPTVNMIRALAYDPSGIIYFKTNITEEYAQLPQRIGKNLPDVLPRPLHLERIQISKNKWQHLQDLKPFLPEDCHLFYDTIPHEI